MAQDSDEPDAPREALAHVTVGDVFIDIEPAVGFERATLRISGPGDYALTKSVTAAEGDSFLTADLLLEAEDARFNSEQLSAWSNLPDGRYYYEVDFIAGDGSMKRETGTFQVQGGAAFQADKEEPLSRIETQEPGLIGRIAGAILDTLVPSAHAQSGDFDDFVSIRNVSGTGESRLNLNATDSIAINDDAWRVMNNADEGFRFEVVQGSGVEQLVILQGGDTGIGTATPQDKLHVNDANGFQMRLDNGAIATRFDTFGGRFAIYGANSAQFQLYHDAPSGSMIIDASGNVTTASNIVAGGNVTSTERFFINSSSSVGFVDYTTSAGEFLAGVGTSGDWGVCDSSAGCFFALRVQSGAPDNSLVVGSGGNVGIGTDAPNTALHVRRSNNTANVRVEDTGSGSPQVMFQLLNNGFPQFNMQDTSQTDMNWSFRLSGNAGSTERFTITKIGTGQAEFELFHDGSANFAGDVTANGVLLTSTREAKTDFRELDEREVLDKLANLEVSQWRYKHEDEETVHFGPVAEEFHEIFGLSDGKRLNMIDTNGIAFAAIKALNTENKALKAENQAIQERLATLEQRLLD